MTNTKNTRIFTIIAIAIAIAIILDILFAFPIMFIWNWLMHDILGFAPITYAQSIIFNLLS